MPTESYVASVDQRSHVRGLVEVGAASVLWGTGGLAVQLIREHEALSPVTISAWRMTIAAAVLVVALLALRRGGELVALARTRPRQLLVVGVGTAAYQGFYFVSVTQVGVAVSTVVSLGLAPVLLTVAESVRHRRMPTGTRLAVLAAALTGLVLVSVAGHESATGPAPVAGVLLAIASGTTYALTTAAGGSISRGTSPLVLTSGMTLVGAAVLLPCLAFVDGPRVTGDPAVLAWLLYLGALTMALAYVLLYSGLRVVAPSTAVTASLVEPVTAAVVAAVVLGESLGPVAVVGILLVLGAVAGLGRPAAAAGPVLPDPLPDPLPDHRSD
ncbi:drug/metabolite transporter, DME family [Nocardioides alpinus]|uniref:Drug/metabolite transporter, DME family n=1 Tax=Nocardioides alpinus TaxID=748909 RepID=A0A1I0WHH8_9ACTN|nr:DMT family transporter [Nocardioides alpinus]PKH37940.1 EamA family transporter [Nocardioides alpinus]SFA88202.1 drug/metabolite transporter, DME family [Nocardioides alpinus]